MTEKPTYEELEKRIQELEKAETERKQAEAILKEIINKNPMSIQILDKEGCTLEVNPSYKSLFGSVPPPDYSIFNDHQLIQKGMGKLFDQLRNGDTVHFPELYFNAHDSLSEFPDIPAWIRTIGFPLYDICEKPEKFVFMHENITDRKQAEQTLKESEERFRTLMEDVDAIAVQGYGPDGVTQYWNTASEMLYGYRKQEAIGCNLLDLIIPPEMKDDVAKAIHEMAESGQPIPSGELLLMHKDGSRIPVISHHAIIKIPGREQELFCLDVDITDRKQAEAEKLIAQKNADDNEKMALVGRIAGKMAHDFNNILGIVMGNTELALLDCLEPNTKKTLELIYEQTIRGKNLTKNLVAFAKDQEPKQEFFSINEKMDLVLNLLKKDLEGINVLRQYERGTPELLADPGMMEHAIVNLVQNSIHAVSLVEQPEILVRTYHQGETIFLEIEDNGCGIPPEFLGEIFEPSFTLKGSKDQSGMYKPGIKGTGYGMSNVKRYIEQHKGDISIHSEVQIGTKVTIKLPVIKKELTFEEIANFKKEKIFFEKHILVVEDEQAILDVQYRILSHEPCNHKVDIANNGQVAIDLLNRNEYDLISLDYVLPGKFNGMDVYHHLREKNQNVPVLFISGNIDFLESIQELKKHDLYVDHLSKPCKNIDYVNCINKLFGIVAI